MADTFKQLKNFPKYEISESGNIVRNHKTKAIISAEKGITYRIYNEAGERVSIKKDELKKQPTVEVEATEEVKEEVAQSPIDATIEKAKAITADVKKDVKPKAVKAKGENRSDEIKKHYEAGKTKKEIVELTGYKPNTVYIVYNRLEKAKKLNAKETEA